MEDNDVTGICKKQAIIIRAHLGARIRTLQYMLFRGTLLLPPNRQFGKAFPRVLLPSHLGVPVCLQGRWETKVVCREMEWAL